MKRFLARRDFLTGSATALAALTLAPRSHAQVVPAAALSERLHVLKAGEANVIALTGPEGLLLVDSGPASTVEALLDSLQALSDQGVRTLINTHWHAEQTGGNEALGLAGARIIAHEKTRLRLSTDYYLPAEERYHRAAPKPAWPVETLFEGSATLRANGESVDYGYLRQAHTDGDLFVYFRQSNVLAVGDVVSPERDPVHDWYGGGWIGGRVDALDLLLAMANDETVIVPAFGPTLNKAQLKAERDLMATLYERTVDAVRQGRDAKEMLAEGVLDGLPRSFEDPYKFLYDLAKGLWAHHNKLAPNIV